MEVARAFFGLPAAQGFLLAGGGALLAQNLTARPTQDLDFFARKAGDVQLARNALMREAASRGWTVDLLTDSETFCRMVLHDGLEDLLVDLAWESAPLQPSTASFLGPTFAPEELAGRKLLALFDRAEVRDFSDVYVLAGLYGTASLLRTAHELDAGFDEVVLASYVLRLDRFADHEVPVPAADVGAVRAFFTTWAKELRG